MTVNKLFKSKYRDMSATDIHGLFESYRVDQDLKKIFTKLSFIPQRMVREYWWAANSTDLLASAYEALLMAIKSYDQTKCNNFYLWVEPWIKKAVGREKYKEKVWQEVLVKSDDVQEHVNDLVYENNYEELSTESEKALVHRLLDTLTPVEKKVIVYSFGLDEGEERSCRQISDSVKISHSKIWRIKREAIKKMKYIYDDVGCQ